MRALGNYLKMRKKPGDTVCKSVLEPIFKARCTVKMATLLARWPIVPIVASWMILFAAAPAHCGSSNKEIPLPAEATPALAYLLSLNRADLPEPPAFDARRMEPILKFIRSPKDKEALYYADASLGEPSAYHEVEIQSSLSRIIRIVYNTRLPGGLCAPNSMRLSYWTGVKGGQPPVSELWRMMPLPDRPVFVRGTEYEEITPDAFTGAYYGYDLNRTLILFRYGGRNVLISLAKQKDRSTVGKKGLIIGPDEDWNYIYTGEKGLNMFGLGWVSSYMFDSYSIIVYDESKLDGPRVKFAVFKWVRAGWKGLNVVRRHHIFSGLKRHASAFKPILENRCVQTVNKLEAAVADIREQPLETLRRRTSCCLESLKARLDRDHKSDAEKLGRVLVNTDYLERLTRREMVSRLSVEYLKGLLGKP